LFFIRIPDGVSNTRIRYSGNEIDFHVIPPGQGSTATIPAGLYIHSFITGTRITIIYPKESADLHRCIWFSALLIAMRSEKRVQGPLTF